MKGNTNHDVLMKRTIILFFKVFLFSITVFLAMFLKRFFREKFSIMAVLVFQNKPYLIDLTFIIEKIKLVSLP